jgi:hypothetical protein
MELIFKRCWNLVTPLRSGAELRSFVLRDTANSAAYIACGNAAAVAGNMSMRQMPTVVGCAVAFLLLSAAMAANVGGQMREMRGAWATAKSLQALHRDALRHYPAVRETPLSNTAALLRTGGENRSGCSKTLPALQHHPQMAEQMNDNRKKD